MSGIDYGLGTTNIDHETGIRYGVIHQDECLQFWAEESESEYPEFEYEGPVDEDGDAADEDDYERQLERWSDGAEPVGFKLDDGTYQAYQPCNDTGDIFITKSPYYTLCRFCSPCAPGAGYLMSEGNVKAYCFGHEAFWGEAEVKAPYRVFRVQPVRGLPCVFLGYDDPEDGNGFLDDPDGSIDPNDYVGLECELVEPLAADGSDSHGWFVRFKDGRVAAVTLDEVRQEVFPDAK